MAKLPSITSVLPNDVRRFLERVREAFNGDNPVVTRADIVESGSHRVNQQDELEFIEPSPTCPFPPAPTNLVAAGAMTTIILEWEGIEYGGTSCHNFTEIYRATVDNIGQAVLIGVSNGKVFADSVEQDSQYYYWVRFVNKTDDVGPFSVSAFASTIRDIEYLIETLSEATGNVSEAPFFQIDEPTVINGVEIPAGTYINSAFIHEAEITSAQIGSLAADKIFAAEGTIAAVIIGEGDIRQAMIGDLQVDNAQIAQAAITEGKIRDAQITLAKIDRASITELSAINANLGTITAGILQSEDGLIVLDLDTGLFVFRSSPDGARMETTASTIKVFDQNGVVRVKIGDLSG